MKNTFLSVLACVLLGGAGFAGELEELRKKVADLEGRTRPNCTVTVANEHGGGSGTVVAAEGGKSLVLTNRHVVENCQQFVVLTHRGPVKATLLAVNPKGGADLAALTVDEELASTQVAIKEVSKGNRLRHWGRASGPQVGTMTGYTPGSEYPGGPLIYSMTTDMLTIPGDSGCGVFNDDGQLVGVIYARKLVRGNIFGEQQCVWLGDVRQFLRSLPGGQFPKLAASVGK